MDTQSSRIHSKLEKSFHIVATGNVVTETQTQELILSGADIVKVGIGLVVFVLPHSKQALATPKSLGIAPHGLEDTLLQTGIMSGDVQGFEVPFCYAGECWQV